MKPIRFFACIASVFWTAIVALGQAQQDTVSSADTTITYGQAFTPPYYGGSGTGNWQFCIGGYTGWNPQPNGPAGTDLGGGNYSTSWTPPSAGSYGFYVAKCGDNTYANSNFSGWWTLTVNKAPMAQPTASSSSYTIYVNQSWGGPGISVPASNGTGATMWCAAGGNDWTSGSWTPTGTGTYSLYVGQKADSNHYGNVTDPAQGDVMINTSPGTLYVVKQNQSSVSISASATTVQTGTTVNFTASGGSGAGSWVWSGASGSGTTASATFNSAGTYTVSVYKQGDSSYNDSNTASVTITVKQVSFMWSFTPSAPVTNTTYNVSVGVNSGGFPYVQLYKGGAYLAGSWYGTQADTSESAAGWVGYSANYWDYTYSFGGSDSTSVYVSVPTTTTFNFSGGPFTYDGGAKSVSVSPNPASATYSTSGTYSAVSPGSYTAYANATGSYSGSGSYTWTINKANPPTVTITASASTVNAGQSVQFTAANDVSSGAWVWGGDATGLSGNPVTVTFNTTGPHTVTVYRAGDSNYNQSNTASVTITVNGGPPPVVTSGAASAVTSTAFNYQIVASNSPTSYGASGLPAGLSVNSAGVISGTPTAAGTFSVTLNATNAGGTGSGTLTLTITFNTADVSTASYQYDKTNQLKSGPEGTYGPDVEGNINTTGQ